jgi:hypothetical protein
MQCQAGTEAHAGQPKGGASPQRVRRGWRGGDVRATRRRRAVGPRRRRVGAQGAGATCGAGQAVGGEASGAGQAGRLAGAVLVVVHLQARQQGWRLSFVMGTIGVGWEGCRRVGAQPSDFGCFAPQKGSEDGRAGSCYSPLRSSQLSSAPGRAGRTRCGRAARGWCRHRSRGCTSRRRCSGGGWQSSDPPVAADWLRHTRCTEAARIAAPCGRWHPCSRAWVQCALLTRRWRAGVAYHTAVPHVVVPTLAAVSLTRRYRPCARWDEPPCQLCRSGRWRCSKEAAGKRCCSSRQNTQLPACLRACWKMDLSLDALWAGQKPTGLPSGACLPAPATSCSPTCRCPPVGTCCRCSPRRSQTRAGPRRSWRARCLRGRPGRPTFHGGGRGWRPHRGCRLEGPLGCAPSLPTRTPRPCRTTLPQRGRTPRRCDCSP